MAVGCACGREQDFHTTPVFIIFLAAEAVSSSAVDTSVAVDGM